jgi:hypothetical protein
VRDGIEKKIRESAAIVANAMMVPPEADEAEAAE